MEQRERLLGGVHVSIFRFSLNVSLMWRRHAAVEVLTFFGVMFLLFGLMLHCPSTHFLEILAYSFPRGML